jgi:AcrR family transcriptional regulator
MGIRQEHIKLQKERILDIVETLFWENGYHGTTMRSVASACKFKPGNLYNYFKNKEELLYEVFRLQMVPIVSAVKHLEAESESNPVERLRFFIRIHVDIVLNSNKGFPGSLFDSESKHLTSHHRKRIVQLRDTYDRILRKIIRAGIENGDFSGVDEKLAASFIASMIVRCRVWFSAKGRLSTVDIAEAIFNFSLNGLKGEKEETGGAKLV